MYFYKFRQTLQNKGDKMSFALTHKEGGDDMSAYDLIWNLIMMLLDQINDSKNEEETNEKDNQCINT